MASENNSSNSGCNCGCFSIIIFLCVLSFFISFLRNCSGRDAIESLTKTTKDYVNVVDSIWNEDTQINEN